MASIQIPDSVAAALQAQAQARGLNLDQYLQWLAESFGRPPAAAITGEELVRLLDREAADGPAYQGTYSRADIYADHADVLSDRQLRVAAGV